MRRMPIPARISPFLPWGCPLGMYAGLARLSPGCPPGRGRLHTCYSPVRRSPPGCASTPRAAPRLACVKPAASVHPEPGSNSALLKYIFRISLFSLLSVFRLRYAGPRRGRLRIGRTGAPEPSLRLTETCKLVPSTAALQGQRRSLLVLSHHVNVLRKPSRSRRLRVQSYCRQAAPPNISAILFRKLPQQLCKPPENPPFTSMLKFVEISMQIFPSAGTQEKPTSWPAFLG